MSQITNGVITLNCEYISNYSNYAYDDNSIKRDCVTCHDIKDSDFDTIKSFFEGGNYKEIVNTVNTIKNEDGTTTEELVVIEKDTFDGYNIIVAIIDKRDGTFDVILGAPTKKEEYQATADMLLLEILGV